MIKLLGVITRGGIPVRVKTYEKLDMKKKKLVPNLLSAVRGISTVMGTDDIRSLDFGEDTLLITESKKEYTVVALTSVAEEYVEGLAKVIAEDIDNSPNIPTSVNVVGEKLIKRIATIFQKYIQKSIETPFSHTIKQIWQKILTNAKENSNITTRTDQLSEKIQETVQLREKEWKEFKEKTSHQGKDAIAYALEGDFDHAFAARLDSLGEDQFMMKMGLLTFSTLGMYTPPVAKLEEVFNSIPEKDPYTTLLQLRLDIIKQETTIDEYIDYIDSIIPYFTLPDTENHLQKAFLLLDGVLARYPAFTHSIATFFKNHSEVLHEYLSILSKRQSIIDRASSASLDLLEELRDEEQEYRFKIDTLTKELDSLINQGFLKRLFNKRPRGHKANKISLTSSITTEIYISLLTLLAQSLVLNPTERRENLKEVLQLYKEYVRTLFKDEFPVPAYFAASIFKWTAIAYYELFPLLQSSEDQYIESIKTLLDDIIGIFVKEYPKLVPYHNSLLAVTASLSNLLSMHSFWFNEAFLLTFLIFKNLDFSTIKTNSLPNKAQMENLMNIFYILSSLAMQVLPPSQERQVLTQCVEAILRLQKIFLLKGHIKRSNLFTLLYYLSQIVETYPKQKLQEIVDSVTGFTRIIIPDWQENDYDLAILGKYLIRFLLKASERLERPDLSQLAKTIYEKAITAWKDYHFDQKVQSLEETYSF